MILHNNKYLNTTLGKTLKTVIKIDNKDILSENNCFNIQCKEITCDIVESPFYLYIDKNDEQHKLSILKSMSIEANINKFYIELPDDFTGKIELWIWS